MKTQYQTLHQDEYSKLNTSHEASGGNWPVSRKLVLAFCSFGQSVFISCTYLSLSVLISYCSNTSVGQLFHKGPDSKYFRVCGHMIFVPAALLFCYSVKRARNRMNECGCVPVKLSLHLQNVSGLDLAMGCSLPTPGKIKSPGHFSLESLSVFDSITS